MATTQLTDSSRFMNHFPFERRKPASFTADVIELQRDRGCPRQLIVTPMRDVPVVITERRWATLEKLLIPTLILFQLTALIVNHLADSRPALLLVPG
jgi:hypothetical protein